MRAGRGRRRARRAGAVARPGGACRSSSTRWSRPSRGGDHEHHTVTVLAPEIDAGTLESGDRSVAACGGNIERIVRLAAYPVHSYELTVAGADLEQLRRALAAEAAIRQVDIAVQVAGLHRRAKHLIVMDADSTLLQGEVIDLLAERRGCGEEVAAVTAAAMAGELDFEDALRRRVACWPVCRRRTSLAVRERIVLTPGARTLVRTLKRLGYELAVVSGGFTQVIAPLVAELGIDHLAANELAVEGGVLTGELEGPSWTAPARRRPWCASPRRPACRWPGPSRWATAPTTSTCWPWPVSGSPSTPSRWCAQAADTALSVPYLDAILFLLGISRRDVERGRPPRHDGDLVTVLAQGEQGQVADNRGQRPLLRGWLHVVAFVGWLIGGPFLIAAGPDTPADGAPLRLRRGHAGHVRHERGLPPDPLVGLRLAPHAAGRPQRDLRRHRRHGDRGGRSGADRMGRGPGPDPGLGRRRGRIALRQVWLDAPQWVVAIPYVVVGWCPIVVAPQLVRGLGGAGSRSCSLAGLVVHGGRTGLRPQAPDPWPRVFGFHEVFHACTAGRRRAVRLRRGVHRAASLLTRPARFARSRRSQAMMPSPRSRPSSSVPEPELAMRAPRRCARRARAPAPRGPRRPRRTSPAGPGSRRAGRRRRCAGARPACGARPGGDRPRPRRRWRPGRRPGRRR